MIKDFFDRFERTAENIEPENIFNYDEINLREDPGTYLIIIITTYFN